MTSGSPEPSRSPARAWLFGTLLVGGLYLGLYLTRGWYPHDEGALGQTAERVLQGQVPHRDFDEPYTGLLTYIHAGAFLLGGIRLAVLRIPLFAATILWLAAFFRIAVRLVSPPAAAGIVLLALAWSVPNYPASIPSWYNLFCATFGIAALIKWDETGARRWLYLAGLAGGVSFLIKLSGLFYLAGALLFLLYATRGEEPEEPRRGWADRVVAGGLTAGLLLFVVMLWRGIAPFYLARPIVHFVAPGVLLAGALAAREWAPAAGRGGVRLRRLVAAALPFLAGALAPVAGFVLGFGLAGGLPALVNGVFVAPFRRLAFANMQPPAPFWILAAVPLAVLLRPRGDWDHPRWRRAAIVVAVLFAIVVWLASVDSFPHRLVWQSIRNLIPLTAAVAAGIVAWPRLSAGWPAAGRRRFVLLATVTALASLVQFPFSSPIYFLYVAPLLLLTLVALIRGLGRTPRLMGAVTLGFYGAFAVLLVTPGATVGLGFRYETPHPTVPLDLPRAGLRVNPEDAQLYGALIPALGLHAGNGDVWAGPDSPEVYFLSGHRNRTRALFDFLGATGEDAAGFLATLDRDGIRAIALNLRPSFSPALSPGMVDSLRARFPEGSEMGRFELRWRR